MKGITFNKKNLGIIAGSLAGAVVLLAAGVVLKKVAGPQAADPVLENLPLSKELLPKIDAAVACPYNKILDKLGDVLLVLSILSAAVFTVIIPGLKAIGSLVNSFASETMERFKMVCFDGLVFLQSFLWTGAIYKILKTLAGRYRPYMYFANPKADALLNGDFCRSWPSGHSSCAFVAVGFFICWFYTRYPDRKAKWFGGTLTTVFAVLTMTMRILSGNHFPTDVMSGAFIGATVTLIVYVLNQLLLKDRLPQGF